MFSLVIQSQEALGSQPPCLRQSDETRFNGHEVTEEARLHTVSGFLFGGLLPPNKKKRLLCALGVSAVEILFWTRVNKYEARQVGATHHTEWWVPAEDLEELNRNIVGTIEVVEADRHFINVMIEGKEKRGRNCCYQQLP
jgi:hypothetical protein